MKMTITLNTMIHTPAFGNKPAWTGTLEEALFPPRAQEITPEYRRADEVMDIRSHGDDCESVEEAVALIWESDIPYIFDNPHARIVK